MKNIPVLVIGTLLALFLIGCPQNDDTSDNSSGGKNDRTLKISNQSSAYMWNVKWNSQEFYKFGDRPTDYIPNLHSGSGLSQGNSATEKVSESGVSSYVFFDFSVKNDITMEFNPGISVRTQELVVVDDDPVEFKITDNTIVVRADGTSYTGTLSGLFENQ